MANTIDMQDLRYLNLFQKITRIQTRHVFHYNDAVYFCVPKFLLQQALGRDVENLRKIGGIIKKRIKIIPIPKNSSHAEHFIKAIISPATFKELEVKGNEIIVTAGNMQNKAMLLGRNKKRLEEMKNIIQSYFGKEFIVA